VAFGRRIKAMEVKIIHSPRRRRTVSARLVKDTLLVNAPALMPEAHLEKIVANFKERFQRKRLEGELNQKGDLMSAAQRLNERYFENKLKVNRIEYVTNQNSRFGCCNYLSGYIRISHMLALMPAWVRDYVIVHEIAHLIQPNHSREFWDIVSRYELAERAKGYLMAVGLRREDDAEDDLYPFS
jgi:predicted metal-dependent hydrolase